MQTVNLIPNSPGWVIYLSCLLSLCTFHLSWLEAIHHFADTGTVLLPTSVLPSSSLFAVVFSHSSATSKFLRLTFKPCM